MQYYYYYCYANTTTATTTTTTGTITLNNVFIQHIECNSFNDNNLSDSHVNFCVHCNRKRDKKQSVNW